MRKGLLDWALRSVSRVRVKRGDFHSKALQCERLEDRRLLATLTVNLATDGNTTNDGNLHFREAIAYVNGTAPLSLDLARIDTSQNPLGVNDTIVFHSNLNGGTITLSSSISVNNPVTIDGPSGKLRLFTTSASIKEALALRPALDGSGDDFEIRDLIFENFEYGIRVDDSGGSPSAATIEGVIIENCEFRNNRRGVYLQDSLYPFTIRNNDMFGAGNGEPIGSTGDAEAGILIHNGTTQANQFAALIADNVIGGYEQYGIAVIGARVPQLAIEGNSIGVDETGNLIPNSTGIHISGIGPDLTEIDRISDGNEIAFNNIGVNLQVVSNVTIEGNVIRDNERDDDDNSGGDGVLIGVESWGNTVRDNEFLRNEDRAVGIGSTINDVSIRNRVSENYFLGNAGLPIDLGLNSVIEANDFNPSNNVDDTDEGPNRRLNHPEVVASGIVELPTQWQVPVRFDTQLTTDYTLEFYRHVPATKVYELIRSVSRSLLNGDLNEVFTFQKGTELQTGDLLAILAIVESLGTEGDTSELGVSPPIVAAKTAAPTSVDLVDSATYDTGKFLDDNVTNRDNSSATKNLQFVVQGTVAGSLVKLYHNGVLIGSQTAGSSTTTVTTNGIVDIGDGLRSITATQTTSGLAESSSVQTSVHIDTVAPKVANVTISASPGTSTHRPFSFDNSDGSGVQLGTVPVGNADTVTITLNEDFGVLLSSNLALKGLAFGTLPTLASGGFNSSGSGASWRFSAPLVADQYVIVLDDAATDLAGNFLDGEWTNPFSVSTTNSAVSEFPSGNNVSGGDFAFVFTILPGDYQRDNSVSGMDFLTWQQRVGGPGRTFIQCDFNGDGYVDGTDLDILNAHYNVELLDLVYADFDNDGDVDGTDYGIWSANYGNTNATHAQGDANGDGQVWGDDLMIFNRQVNTRITWVA